MTITVPASDDAANAEVYAALAAMKAAERITTQEITATDHDHAHPMKVLTADQITDAFVEWFYGTAIEGWYEDSGIDWDDAINRAEDDDHDFGPRMDSPAIIKLRRKVRAIRHEEGY